MTDPLEKTNVLNQHFKYVFTTDDNTTIPDKGPSLFPSLPQFQIMEQGVYNIPSNCDSSKSPEPDSIHSFTLKATATEISPMLAHIFSQSLETGSVPSDWKRAYVTPIFKKVQNLIQETIDSTHFTHIRSMQDNETYPSEPNYETSRR